ncbi:MAG: hypothetical protein F6K17_21395 [Okeania sp. SIO3C4]|nr:hypothetical protein [Okeania sp. SIO3B3]NER04967.1 hypothetical protein [Okeania sp. SIO3C4]
MAISGLFNKINKTAKILILGFFSLIITLSIWVVLELRVGFLYFVTIYSLHLFIILSWITMIVIVAYLLNIKHQLKTKKTTRIITDRIITEKNLDKLSSASSEEKRLMCFSRMGFYFSLGTIFFIFLQVRSQLHCFTLGEILVLAGGAIASLSATLIPLIYILFKPIKIFSKYRKAEPNLIRA